jgi:hypothetical protein
MHTFSVFRRLLVMAASVTAAAAVGVSGAAAASATPPSGSWIPWMCVNGTTEAQIGGCAVGDGSSPVRVAASKTGVTTNWTTYEYKYDHQEIKQADTDLCMQLDAKKDVVIEATCNGASYQEWGPYVPKEGWVGQVRSDWDRDVCLTYNQSGHDLYVRGCVQNPPGNADAIQQMFYTFQGH